MLSTFAELKNLSLVSQHSPPLSQTHIPSHYDFALKCKQPGYSISYHLDFFQIQKTIYLSLNVGVI